MACSWHRLAGEISADEFPNSKFVTKRRSPYLVGRRDNK